MKNRDPLLSPDWYRIAYLTPRLRPGIEVSQQLTRGQCWYVLSDPVSGRHYRFNEQGYQFLSALDGNATIDEVWASQAEGGDESVATQSQVIKILAQAFAENLFVGNLEPDVEAIVYEQQKRHRKRRNAALNPLAFKIPIWDPDQMLSRYLSHVAWLLSPTARILMLTLIAFGFVILIFNASAFTNYARVHLGTSSMLLMLWLVFPVIKVIHEFAHAFSVKMHGGEVHEMGVTLLMMTPIPYVDASASNAFPRKGDRIQVAAAGILVEAFLASLALTVWLLLEPGLVRELAFAVVFAGALSTLFVNGNPLLRFDGYFVFADFIEVPNLGSRSGLFWQTLLKRRLLGIENARLDSMLPGEHKWLWLYAPTSWLYRLSLIIAISFLLASWSPWLGFLMLLVGGWMLVGKPVSRVLHWLCTGADLHGYRLRAYSVATGLTAVTMALVLSAPIPNRTYASGIVWLPENAVLRADADGVVERILIRDKQIVNPGTPVAILRNNRLRTELAKLDAELDAQRVEQARQFEEDASESISGRESYDALVEQRDAIAKKVEYLTVRARTYGAISVSPGQISRGQYLRKGTVVAHVVPRSGTTVRAMVRNEDVALVRESVQAVSVALPITGADPLQASLVQIVPKATRHLASPAMSMEAGGSIEVQPGLAKQVQAVQPRFAVDLKLNTTMSSPVGARALAVFDHGSTTVVGWVGRKVRDSFLRHFSV